MNFVRLRSQTLALLPTLLLPLSLWAQESDDHSPVEKEMNVINRNVRRLSRQYADPAQKASSLELVTAMQKSADTAKDLTPSKAAKLPEAEKAKYMDTYKSEMDALIKELGTLKEALDAGENDKAKAELDKINQLKNSSHKKLGVQMGGGRGGPGGRPGGPGGGSPRSKGSPSGPAPAPMGSAPQ